MHNQKPNHCRECGKQLTDPDSIAASIGPDCAAKANQAFGLLVDAVDAVTSGKAKDFRLELGVKAYNQLQRIYAAKEKRGYVDPKLIRALTNARDTVIRRAAQLSIVTLPGGHHV